MPLSRVCANPLKKKKKKRQGQVTGLNHSTNHTRARTSTHNRTNATPSSRRCSGLLPHAQYGVGTRELPRTALTSKGQPRAQDSRSRVYFAVNRTDNNNSAFTVSAGVGALAAEEASADCSRWLCSREAIGAAAASSELPAVGTDVSHASGTIGREHFAFPRVRDRCGQHRLPPPPPRTAAHEESAEAVSCFTQGVGCDPESPLVAAARSGARRIRRRVGADDRTDARVR